MAKGVLGNDPFLRGAADHASQSKARAEKRMDEKLASTPAGTELKDPRNRKPKKGRAPVHPPAGPEERADEPRDPARDATVQIQQTAPEPSTAETPLPRDRVGQARTSRQKAAAKTKGAAPVAAKTAGPSPRAKRSKAPPTSLAAPPANTSRDEALTGHVSGRTGDDAGTPAVSAATTEAAHVQEDFRARSTASAPALSDDLEAAEEAAPASGDDFRETAKESARSVAREAVERASGALTLAREVASQSLRSDALGGLARMAGGVFSAVMTGLGASGSDEVDAYGKDEKLARQLLPLSDFIYDKYWRVTVEGASHLPAGPSILVANHSGAIPVDGFILHQALLRERPDLPEARWLAEDQIFHAPFVGTLFNRLGAIRASPENAVRLLEEGRPVITFPEGVHGIRKPFAERYQLKRLGRGGFAKLAVRHQVPIVPVAIVGAEESLPLLAKLPGAAFGLPYLPVTVPPLPARWRIRFGEPISVEAIPAGQAEDLVAIQRLVERTRDAIEGMLRALLKDRPSVF